MTRPRKEQTFGPDPFQMLVDRHATQLIELIGGDAFTIGDEIHVREMAGDGYLERWTGREAWIRVTSKERLTKAIPTGVVLLTVELVRSTA